MLGGGNHSSECNLLSCCLNYSQLHYRAGRPSVRADSSRDWITATLLLLVFVGASWIGYSLVRAQCDSKISVQRSLVGY